ncbi:MAG: antitoxin [Thermoprotei archaeon]|nr:MAG: antitoxin [Thermofilum sp. ex4484_79]RLE58449.1 MAG: antitoxin [Thermoprotei archaeon]
MKTLTIRDDVYEKLVKLKKEGESFSDLLERLLSREKVSLREFYGSLKDSKFLEELEKEILEFRKKAKVREIP